MPDIFKLLKASSSKISKTAKRLKQNAMINRMHGFRKTRIRQIREILIQDFCSEGYPGNLQNGSLLNFETVNLWKVSETFYF